MDNKHAFTSEKQEVHEAFDQTTTAELSEEECSPDRRILGKKKKKKKKKNYPGFILGIQ